jgi:hypothetical protein
MYVLDKLFKQTQMSSESMVVCLVKKHLERWIFNPETGYDDYPRWNETVECIQMQSFMANRGYQATKT